MGLLAMHRDHAVGTRNHPRQLLPDLIGRHLHRAQTCQPLQIPGPHRGTRRPRPQTGALKTVASGKMIEHHHRGLITIPPPRPIGTLRIQPGRITIDFRQERIDTVEEHLGSVRVFGVRGNDVSSPAIASGGSVVAGPETTEAAAGGRWRDPQRARSRPQPYRRGSREPVVAVGAGGIAGRHRRRRRCRGHRPRRSSGCCPPTVAGPGAAPHRTLPQIPPVAGHRTHIDRDTHPLASPH